MNAQFDQLPPVDPTIREQLARRSAGRLPDGLVVDVFAALDSRPPRRTIWRFPRLAVASISVALIAILAVTIAFSGTHTAPAASLAGYPAERALTTAELAALMAGPPLPVNTALVASATIDVRTDVCPMNRYQTQGVVEGMGSQVCVMTADVAVQPMTLTGTFAMRYLAPGYLLLVGALTPASTSGLAFRVADDWPLAGKTFLTQGWLYYTGLTGNDPSACSQASPDANGTYSCTISWMSDSPNATAVHDANGLPGPPNGVPARSVGMTPDVADMDHIASRDNSVFVVATVTEQCPNASPRNILGCTSWHVLAKVADISMPAPNRSAASDAPTTAPPATPIASPSAGIAVAPTGLIGPNSRALTPPELSALIAADPNHLSGRYVIDERVTCDGTDCTGFAPKAVADTIGSNGQIGLVGPVNVRPDDSLVWTIPQVIAALPGQPGIYLVDAWISGAGMLSCDVAGSPCYETSWLAPTASELWLGSPAFGQRLDAQLGAYHQFGQGQVGGGAAIHGLFLFEWVPGGKCGVGVDTTGLDTCSPHAQILARLEPAVLP